MTKWIVPEDMKDVYTYLLCTNSAQLPESSEIGDAVVAGAKSESGCQAYFSFTPEDGGKFFHGFEV
jgi:hypothetical protein